MVGTAKTSHMLLLFTSLVLISIGIYGTIVSKEYGCDNGINIKLYGDDENAIKDLTSQDCLNYIQNFDPTKTIDPSNILQHCNSKFTQCISDIPNLKNKSSVNKFDKCLNDNGKGYVRCMEGGLLGLSITSIVIGALMLILSAYLLFI
jgi:hypothetical protein